MQDLFISSESIDTTLLVLTSKHKQDSDCDDERKQVDLTLRMEWAPSRRVDVASKGQLGN